MTRLRATEQALEPFAVLRWPSANVVKPRRRQRAPGGRPPTFTRHEILAKIRDWVDLYGEPPTLSDWEPSRARRMGQLWRVERFEAGTWPTTRMVVAQFGRHTTAITEAGFALRRRPPRAKPKLAGPEQILVAIREWTARYGEPPTLADWDSVRARRLGHEWRVVRYRSGDWPSLRTVLHHYGSLGAAVSAAGLEPRPTGLNGQQVADFRALNRSKLVTVRAAERDENLTVAESLREIARHRASGDADALHYALLLLATAAMQWANNLAQTDVNGLTLSTR